MAWRWIEKWWRTGRRVNRCSTHNLFAMLHSADRRCSIGNVRYPMRYPYIQKRMYGSIVMVIILESCPITYKGLLLVLWILNNHITCTVMHGRVMSAF